MLRSLGSLSRHLFATLVAITFVGSAVSAPLPNPAPADFADDIDGSGYFKPVGDGSLALELFDLGDGVASFGFFARGAPNTRIPIFEAADTTGSSAIVDFVNGFVYDVEDSAIQSLFAAPITEIGFYLDLDSLGILFSDPGLNLGGADVMGAYPALAAPDSFSLMFMGVDGTVYGWEYLTGLQASVIPVPGSVALLGLGMLLLAARRRSRELSA